MQFAVREQIKVISELARRPGYRPRHQAVLTELLLLENSVNGSCQPSQAKIAQRIGCCRGTVNRAVQWLRRCGAIKTVQLRVRQDNGAWFKGRLRYWMAKEPGQVAWIEAAWKRSRVESLLAGKEIQRRYSRCNNAATRPSTSVLNSDTFFAPNENLASPALQRLMKQKRWRS